MPPTDQHVSIFFADVCDSMPLYEESGDASALALIGRCLDELAALAARFGGTVIRSKGDDLLCIFETPANALDAAAAMLDVYRNAVPAIHVGIHHGPVIRARNDVYGDAVNVAARMLALAKPGEMVASKDLVDALPPAARRRLARLGRRAIKGKQEPIDIYSMVLDDGPATQLLSDSGAGVDSASRATVMPSVTIELRHAGRRITVRDGERCLIGRAERCGLVIEDPRVSREHARIEVHGGRAMLTDQSSTGSWIIDHEGAHRTLRRESATLGAAGRIRLSLHPNDPQSAPEIAFRLNILV